MAYFYFHELYFDVAATDFLEWVGAALKRDQIELVPTTYNSQDGDKMVSLSRPDEKAYALTVRCPTAASFGPVHRAMHEFKKERHAVTLGLSYLENFWTATLSEGWNQLDHFSTLPHYMEQTEADWERMRGDARLVARTCGVPLEIVSAYYRWWEPPYDVGFEEARAKPRPPMLSGKAMEGDFYPYGVAGQMFDFSKRLGGCEHVDDGPAWQHFTCVRGKN